MKSLRNHLREELRDDDFRQAYEKDLRLAKLAVQIAKSREKIGLTQAQLATRAHITQQQVSKVEHAGASGFNVNTLIRVCDALGLELTLSPRKSSGEKAAKKPITAASRKKTVTNKTAGGIYRLQKTTTKRAVATR